MSQIEGFWSLSLDQKFNLIARLNAQQDDKTLDRLNEEAYSDPSRRDASAVIKEIASVRRRRPDYEQQAREQFARDEYAIAKLARGHGLHFTDRYGNATPSWGEGSEALKAAIRARGGDPSKL